MGALDHDADGQVDITEYFVTLCTLGIIIYESGKGGAGCKKWKSDFHFMYRHVYMETTGLHVLQSINPVKQVRIFAFVQITSSQ